MPFWATSAFSKLQIRRVTRCTSRYSYFSFDNSHTSLHYAGLRGDFGIMGNAKNVGDRKLVVLSGKAKGTAFVLTKSEVNAGRESDNAICLKGKRVSRYHAVLVRNNGEYTLRDVSPHIGTLLNGRRTKEAHLKLGDRIRIGEIEMSYEAATKDAAAPVIDDSATATPAPINEVAVPVVAAPQEPAAELVAEDLTSEYQQHVAELTERLGAMSQENATLAKLNGELQEKISEGVISAEEAHRVEAKLTQETKRLVGEVKTANEAMESLRAQLQTRSEQQAETQETMRLAGEVKTANEAMESLRVQLQTQSNQQTELTERFTIVSQENSRLVKRNGELQAKISKLEASAAKAARMEIELTTAQEALHKMSEKLAKARELAKPNASTEPADHEEIPLSSFERVVAAEPIALGRRSKIIDLSAPIKPVAVGSDEAQMAAAKKQEEAVAKRQVSEKTHEQFDSLRRTIVEKKNLRANMSLFERFMLPFRDTARLVVEQENANPE
jgi:pSer/pThr/pTyr-binding forkhead associated (FHA) protein